MFQRSIATFIAISCAVGCAGVSAEAPDGKKLTLMKPMDEMIQRGDRGEVMLTVDREQFDEEIEVEVDDLPKGIEVLNPTLVIPRGQSTFTLLLEAKSDADLVDEHVVRVKVLGPDDLDVVQTFDITVRAAS